MTRWILGVLCCGAIAVGQDRPWRRVVVPPVAEVARNFERPPAEYAMTMWWFWNGPMTEADIRRDLHEMNRQGVRAVMIWPYVGLGIQYLSPTWFERVRYAVEQARELGMRVWLEDEGGYPSGYVGGNIVRERPHQRMRVLAQQADGSVRSEFRTPPTRYVHQPGFAKNADYSLYDSLDAAATRDFLTDVHERYKRAVGDEFGKTVLGIMGDEPSFSGVPYTDGIFEEFERLKGYDPRPHLAELFEGASAFKADYWDVWTRLYRDHFFAPQAEWCEREKIESLMHVCGEEDMRSLIGSNGDYFRCFRPMQIPGIDAIWRQIWPDKIADFPKLASSGAHQWGRPRAFVEAFAVYGRGVSLEQAKWVLDHLFVRGVNLIQMMEYLSSAETFRTFFHPPDWHSSPQWQMFGKLAGYVNRLSYLLAVGRPAAEIAIYYPTTSGWMGDFDANKYGLDLARQLLERQRDFDFIDDDTLAGVVKTRGGALVNLSGQSYRTVVVPPLAVISEGALARLREFAGQGGKVIFIGKLPARVAGRTYLYAAKGPEQLPWAKVERFGEISESVLAELPAPDVVVEPAPAPGLKYLHRRLADGEVYFLFNEEAHPLALTLRLRGEGDAQAWDPETGRQVGVDGATRQGGYARVPMKMSGHETRVVVLAREKRPGEVLSKEFADAVTVKGSWSVRIAEKNFTGRLQPWSEYGMPAFFGTALYRTRFELPTEWSGRRAGLWLDLGEVKYSARVRLNGEEVGGRAWRPFRFPVGKLLRAGENQLEIEVTNTRANELAGDAKQYREIEEKGWLRGSYVKIYQKFDQEMVPSGLLGPVKLLVER
jgi:hypothetical protein